MSSVRLIAYSNEIATIGNSAPSPDRGRRLFRIWMPGGRWNRSEVQRYSRRITPRFSVPERSEGEERSDESNPLTPTSISKSRSIPYKLTCPAAVFSGTSLPEFDRVPRLLFSCFLTDALVFQIFKRWTLPLLFTRLPGRSLPEVLHCA